MSLLLSLVGGAGGKLAMLLGAVCAAGMAYFGIRRSGIQAQQAADARKTVREVEGAKTASDAVARMSDAAVTDKLRADWTR